MTTLTKVRRMREDTPKQTSMGLIHFKNSRHDPPRQLRQRNRLRTQHRVHNSKHNRLRLRADLPKLRPKHLANPPNNDR
jgi:hypothetical protein